jgi:hypothetical protein
MKRSKVNSLIFNAIQFIENKGFCLPRFAYWNLDDWNQNKLKATTIFEAQLGWDVTDLGEGDFDKLGLILFTLRNRSYYPNGQILRDYAEKIMVIRKGQNIPLHFHQIKVEDIINRGGGILKIEFHNVSDSNQIEGGNCHILMDGIWLEIQSGGTINLSPGESVTIPQRCFHKFGADNNDVLIGEVSTSNDDYIDNYFLKTFSRFPSIIEDEEPRYLLANDYQPFLTGNYPIL